MPVFLVLLLGQILLAGPVQAGHVAGPDPNGVTVTITDVQTQRQDVQLLVWVELTVRLQYAGLPYTMPGEPVSGHVTVTATESPCPPEDLGCLALPERVTRTQTFEDETGLTGGTSISVGPFTFLRGVCDPLDVGAYAQHGDEPGAPWDQDGGSLYGCP